MRYRVIRQIDLENEGCDIYYIEYKYWWSPIWFKYNTLDINGEFYLLWFFSLEQAKEFIKNINSKKDKKEIREVVFEISE